MHPLPHRRELHAQDSRHVTDTRLAAEYGGIAKVMPIYAALFGIGYWLYGEYLLALVLTVTAVVGTVYVVKQWGRLSGSSATDTADLPPRGR